MKVWGWIGVGGLAFLAVGGTSLGGPSAFGDAEGSSNIRLTKSAFPLAIWFGDGKSVVKCGPHNAPVFEKFKGELKRYPVVHMEIEGSPDAGDSAAFNRKLSLRRAQALRAVFADLYGIPSERIQARAAGETGAASAAPSDAASNRPVWVILYRLEP